MGYRVRTSLYLALPFLPSSFGRRVPNLRWSFSEREGIVGPARSAGSRVDTGGGTLQGNGTGGKWGLVVAGCTAGLALLELLLMLLAVHCAGNIARGEWRKWD